MTTIKATGIHPQGLTPTLTISSGRGNTRKPEIHLILRDDTGDSESSRSVMAWFERDALVDAIRAADAGIRHAIEVGEPA